MNQKLIFDTMGELEQDDEDQIQKRKRPNNLTYNKISFADRVNVIYSKNVLKMTTDEISKQYFINYNSIRNIIKAHDEMVAECEREEVPSMQNDDDEYLPYKTQTIKQLVNISK